MTAAAFSLPPPDRDSIGYGKRLDFVVDALRAVQPRRILDVGCGTGAMLTAPIAAAFPAAQVLGIDSDAASIAWAQANLTAANLDFATTIAADQTFDAIIASEVMEHVEDPHAFLLFLRHHLAPGGVLVVTVPNGWGPSELMALAEVGLTLSGAQAWLSRLKRLLLGQARAPEAATLAISPHVQFFTAADLRRLFAQAGLAVSAHRARTIACGWILDSLVSALRLGRINASLADHLPALASDWMFVLRAEAPPGPGGWRRGTVAAWRRRLVLRRWGLAP